MWNTGTISYREPNGTMDNTATLGDYFTYDPNSGRITRKVKTGPRGRLHSEAGYLRSDGYRMIEFFNKQFYAHRLAWFLYYGEWPKDTIDHINRNRADNRICNLRVVSQSINNLNSKRPLPATAERFIWHKKGKFQVVVTRDKKRESLGTFDTLQQAIITRDINQDPA